MGPDDPNDPFLFARLIYTAWKDTEHAIYNTAARAIGSDSRMRYRTVDGSETFETELYSVQLNTIEDVAEELISTGLDLAAVSSGKIVDGNTLLSTTESKGSASREVKEIIHANSKLSDKAQHNYNILDTWFDNKRVKTGISSGKETKDGKSYRGQSQANKWNKEDETPGKYVSEIVNRIPEGKGARLKALDYESKDAKKLLDQLDPTRHKRP
ncbi:hypothetical protein [Sphingobacterium sp. LRF_L2]|uniref:hypothetical protein n=1 Tax=Sphingobacterium sp. LRF_L2 TaxID=3369421 RepID=UPI003F608FD0